ncbi:DUF4355 domain-containing protein [Limosilactobacillus reuteri]|uniref:DUF4355 domain-containing protein n=1 Tax=Limosilactobacillus reuteri TaxID=1598 RepID=UPI0021A7DA8F|nr:DUF4355 domain-containing protein [Limosilactobacillus reuteri]MCT3189787.1 DUF4355 domain-containing protein [Limosilactobacillus reuteri]MCT3198088.1 DUF4355 domain-containing protein [Limosilactobacillus reuteri]
MEDKLPMNLQFFAEGGEPATGSESGPTDTEVTGNDPTPEEGTEKTFTQAEVDEMLRKATADKEQEITDAKKEATKYAKLNKEQQKDYDLDKAKQRATEAEAKLARYEMRDTARQQLIDGGYKNPTDEDIDLIVTEKAETTKANGETFLKVVERIRQSVRDELLQGNTPQINGTKIKVPTLDEFKKMSYAERVDLKTKNPQAYDKLVQESY